MYTYTITFNKDIMVGKARQGLLLFLEVFYDSTKAMICPISGLEQAEILFFEEKVPAPRFTMVETIISVADQKMMRFVQIVNTLLKETVIEKIKISYQHFPDED